MVVIALNVNNVCLTQVVVNSIIQCDIYYNNGLEMIVLSIPGDKPQRLSHDLNPALLKVVWLIYECVKGDFGNRLTREHQI